MMRKITSSFFGSVLFLSLLLFSCQRYTCNCDVAFSQSLGNQLDKGNSFDVKTTSYGRAERACINKGSDKGVNCYIEIDY